MKLKKTIWAAFILFALGLLVFSFFKDFDRVLWFAVGGGLAFFNIVLAAWVVAVGLQNIRSSPLFLGFLLLKSLTFVVVVAFIVVFLKPLLLPFTLGLGIVMVGSVMAAYLEWKHYKVVTNKK